MSNHALGADTWDEFVGQDILAERIQVELDAVRAAPGYAPFPHTLLYAFPGAGKTTLARIIANELDDDIDTFVMPAKPHLIENRLYTYEPGILFFDEVHRASKDQQESFLTLMEEEYYTTKNGSVIHTDSMCVIAATTKPELLDDAFADRFDIKVRFANYSSEEMAAIVELMASKAEVDLDDETIVALGRASGGTPRNARRLVRAARALTRGGRDVTVKTILAHVGVTYDGLTEDQCTYLLALKRLNNTAGEAKIANVMQVSQSSIPEIERLLFDLGYIDYTAQGRTLTGAGHRRLKELNNA